MKEKGGGVMERERSREQEINHWAETLEIVMMTTKYNQQQLSEKLHKDPDRISDYVCRKRNPQRANKQIMLDKLKQIITAPKKINTQVHGRIYM
jgi:hypothetical protein